MNDFSYYNYYIIIIIIIYHFLIDDFSYIFFFILNSVSNEGLMIRAFCISFSSFLSIIRNIFPS